MQGALDPMAMTNFGAKPALHNINAPGFKTQVDAKQLMNMEYPSPSDESSVACELLDSEIFHKGRKESSDGDTSIDKDIDERYLVSSKHINSNKNNGGGLSAKKLKEGQEIKKSMISTENQS